MRRVDRVFAILAVAMLAFVLVACSSGGSTTGGSTGGTTTGGSGGGTAPKSAAVQMKNFAFDPASVEVAVGGTVTWTNNDTTTHTVTGPDWKSGDVAPGATFSQTFATAGTFDYHCSIHPSMTGTVVVK